MPVMEAERQKGIDAEKQLLRGQTLAGKAPQKEKPSAGSGRLQAPEIVDSASLQFATDDEGEGGVSMEGEGLAVDAKEGKMQSVEAASLLSPTAAAAAKAAASGLAADIQKKLQRAERFGMPVQLSEEEKRNSRAERFGMGGSTIPGKSEELKRKARADRFGLAAQPTRDEDEKKKARLARFGEGPAPDNLEQEKRKARAARFSQAAPSDSNGQDKSATVETK